MINNYSDDKGLKGGFSGNIRLCLCFFIFASISLLSPLFLFDDLASSVTKFVTFYNIVPFCFILAVVMGLLACVLESNANKKTE